MRNKKLQVWLPLIFSLVMIAGMFFGFKLNQQTGGNQNFFTKDRHTSLQEALDVIRDHYVDAVRMDSLQHDAITDVMNHLDPHSVFIPASNLGEMNEQLRGEFSGIGVEFNIFSDTVHILYVIPGGPSEKAGLLIGDRILKVEDSSIVSKTLPSSDIRRMIRGKKGTVVKLTIKRGHEIRDIHVTRGAIPLPSLDAAYMMDGSIGYIKLNKFSETTYREFMQAMERLKAAGMQKLILDLRDNGGGFITQAVSIADEFLDGDKLLVYTQGSNIPRQEYRARKEGIFEKGKLVILVDELTASASEILAGAVQDWDRGLVIGRRTFGKGLVQENFGLRDGSALRLTVARYYTPSGRSIQRPYSPGGKKIYMEEFYHRYENGELVTPDSVHHAADQVFQTASGRRVYGGGGIMPDIFVPVDTAFFTRHVTQLYLDGRFNNFVYKYYISNPSRFRQYRTPAELAARFNDLEDAWEKLVIYALRDSINLKNIPREEKISIQHRIKAYLARLKWRTQGFYEVSNLYDPVVLKAKEALAN